MGSRSKALVSFRSQSASASASAAASAAASFETVRLRFGAEDDDEDPADKEFAAPADLVLLLDEDRERPAVPGRLLLLEEEEVEDALFEKAVVDVQAEEDAKAAEREAKKASGSP